MKIFKHFAVSAALALAGATAAQAAVEHHTFLLTDSNQSSPGDASGEFDLSSTGLDVFTQIAPQRLAGDTFVDEYLFNIPDDEDVSLFVQDTYSAYGKHHAILPNVTFSGYTVTDYGSASQLYNFSEDLSTPYLLIADGLTLSSGFYDLVVDGRINVNGGGYTGQVDTLPAVPEPQNALLMLASLAAMGALVRRRRQGQS